MDERAWKRSWLTTGENIDRLWVMEEARKNGTKKQSRESGERNEGRTRGRNEEIKREAGIGIGEERRRTKECGGGGGGERDGGQPGRRVR